jgi:hypothetical protein
MDIRQGRYWDGRLHHIVKESRGNPERVFKAIRQNQRANLE